MMFFPHKCQISWTSYAPILVLSAWGFVIVTASFLFLYAGYWLDQSFGTSPTFMLGLFFLAVFISIFRLYQDAWKQRDLF